MSNPGIRSKNRSPDESRDQLFPSDGLSILGGVVLFIFVAALLFSVAVVMKACSIVKKTTIQTQANIAVTQDQAQQIQQQWQQMHPSVTPPVIQSADTGLWQANVIIPAKLSSVTYAPFVSAFFSAAAPMYILMSILLIFAIFWAVRGKPTYVAAVQAFIIGIAWLGVAIIVASQYKAAITPPRQYLEALQGAITNNKVVTQQLVLPPSDILNIKDDLPAAFVQGSVYGSIALVAVFALIVVIARATPYEQAQQ